MSNEEQNSRWICHICDYSSTIGEGQACSQCYKIACPEHMTVSTVYNPATGLYELQAVCVECHLRKIL
ncbi:MAG: hypothetical protein GXP51_06880 [Deltaproteobacteria bacterium]|nr:hypothetical protein [Deltaproteobacteria bacterium]